jgi:hypothetical protein
LKLSSHGGNYFPEMFFFSAFSHCRAVKDVQSSFPYMASIYLEADALSSCDIAGPILKVVSDLKLSFVCLFHYTVGCAFSMTMECTDRITSTEAVHWEKNVMLFLNKFVNERVDGDLAC